MVVDPQQFLVAHPACWISRRAPEFPVHNVHALDILAPPTRVFAALSNLGNLSPAWYWRALYAIRGIAGKLFRWDPGLRWHGPEPLVPGNHYAFFLIEHVAAPGSATNPTAEFPYELGVSVENHLTLALMSYVVAPHGCGTRLYNATCALFKGRTGRAYWRVIRPFHDALIEDMLQNLRRRAERQGNSVL
ncbi:MAG: DUF2867 domain-containing protein [Acidobacteria bacterium]|nr:DUF2867 domain-containing protein [Acidobacteriota bacterium]